MSCLAEQAKILCDEAEENNKDSQWHRWHVCSLCGQQYHGVVACALAWAGWKTYVGRPDEHWSRLLAIRLVANGLGRVKRREDALTVRETELAMVRRLGTSEENVLITQSNLANTYQLLGRLEEALPLRRDVYSGRLKLLGEDHLYTLGAAVNYASTLFALDHYAEAKALLRQTVPVARRVLGDNHEVTLKMRQIYACALCADPAATLNDLGETVAKLEDIAPIARRVLGGAHPTTVGIEGALEKSRELLRACEASESGVDVSSVCGAMEAMAPGDA